MCTSESQRWSTPRGLRASGWLSCVGCRRTADCPPWSVPGSLWTPSCERLHGLLAVFHAKAKRGPTIDEAGSVDGLRARWTANIAEMEPFRGDPLAPDVLDELAERALRYLDGRGPLFAARVEAGLICDGHGDLTTDDVFCLPDGPRALDCLEFDDRLRWVDGLDDAAFLAMDLERLGKPELATTFLNYYTEFTGGRRIISLEHHYLAYRAVVRAKVSSVRYVQGVGEAAEQARLLAALALGHLRAGESRLILVGGLPGTGKSTVAGGVADELNAVLLRSDRVRKEDEQRDPRSSGAGEWEHGLYRPDATRHTYAILLRRARATRLWGKCGSRRELERCGPTGVGAAAGRRRLEPLGRAALRGAYVRGRRTH